MKTSRRRAFALPFVLVIGCGGSPKAPAAPVEDNLPPPPGTGKVTKSTTADGITMLEYESGDRVFVHKDGTCHAEYNSRCPQQEDENGVPVTSTCNPPPPQQVKCPADAK